MVPDYLSLINVTSRPPEADGVGRPRTVLRRSLTCCTRPSLSDMFQSTGPALPGTISIDF